MVEALRDSSRRLTESANPPESLVEKLVRNQSDSKSPLLQPTIGRLTAEALAAMRFGYDHHNQMTRIVYRRITALHKTNP